MRPLPPIAESAALRRVWSEAAASVAAEVERNERRESVFMAASIDARCRFAKPDLPPIPKCRERRFLTQRRKGKREEDAEEIIHLSPRNSPAPIASLDTRRASHHSHFKR